MKDDIADDLEWPLKAISGTVNGLYLKNTANIMYEVNNNEGSPIPLPSC